MAKKELFNQTLITETDSDHRLALGKVGEDGCKNILLSSLFKMEQSKAVLSTGTTITFSVAFDSADYVLFIRSHNGIGYEITSQTAAGFTIEPLENDTIDYLAIKF